MQSRKVEGGEQASEMPPSPLPGERTCRGLLNDLHSRHSWQVKKEAVQLRSLTRSDDPAVLGGGDGDEARYRTIYHNDGDKSNNGQLFCHWLPVGHILHAPAHMGTSNTFLQTV